MPTFASYDGTVLAYHVAGDGPVLVCHPGGPGRASAYLGDLGGLTGTCTVIRLDPRGTGESAVPVDPATYRMDFLMEDLEALRAHLGLDSMNLLGHSAGSNVTALYAAAYPERVRRLIQLTGITRVAGCLPIGRDEAFAARSGEPWYAEAFAAGKAWEALPGDASEAEQAPLRAAMEPFYYGRWDAAAAVHAAASRAQMNPVARDAFGAGYPLDPPPLVAKLATLAAPVLVIAGEVDTSPTPAAAAAIAALFPHSTLVVIPGGGHYPWLDDPAATATAIGAFLGQ